MEVTWSIIDSPPKIVIFCWGWLRYKLPVQGWGWWHMKRFIVCMVAFRESLKGDLKVLPRGWRKNIVFWTDSEINRNGHDSSSSGQCMSAVINNLCTYSCPWFALGVYVSFMHVHCTHTHIYNYIYICIYTLGGGDSFKKPWLHDRCFFRDFHLFPDALRLHWLRGHCGQYPWRSWL
jgi:hypothetical protein